MDAADDDALDVNCGRCGKRLQVRVHEIRALLTIDCEDCKKLPSREPPAADAGGGTAHHEASVRAGARLSLRRCSPES